MALITSCYGIMRFSERPTAVFTSGADVRRGEEHLQRAGQALDGEPRLRAGCRRWVMAYSCTPYR